MQSEIRISVPSWVDECVDWERAHATMDDRAAVAIALARLNITNGAGGPFGAVICESKTGRIVSAGVNLVVPLNNSTLHAEIVAFMLAQSRLGRYSLGASDSSGYELVTSCEPCAMCLGATLWSGVHRLVCCASGDDAREFAFDEGPVFDQSWRYLADRGIEIIRGVRRDEARAVMAEYAAHDGVIYNAT